VTQNVLRLLPPDHRTSGNQLGHKILMGINFYGYEVSPLYNFVLRASFCVVAHRGA
jgi:hypothetical protein